MQYTKGYKYQLHEDYIIQTKVIGFAYNSQFLHLEIDGKLTIRSGYAWDGASFIIIDTKSVMIASLVHDALYQLMRQGAIPSFFKEVADKLYYDLCIKNKCWKWRANYMLRGLTAGGKASTLPKNKKKIITVP